MSEQALPPVVTALISPRSVKSCANIEWSITQTNDRRTTGRRHSLCVSLSNIGATVKHNLTPLNAHTPRLAASRPSFPPDPLPLAFDPRVRASTKFEGDRPQQKGKERREREGRRVKTTISTSQFAAERHRRRPTGRRGSRRRRCAHPAVRPSVLLLPPPDDGAEVVFVFEKPNINGMR